MDATGEPQEIEKKVALVPDEAQAIRVVDGPSYERAGLLLTTIKGFRAEINRTFDPIISKAHEAHREALAQKKRHDEPLVRAEAILKPRMVAYLQAEDEKRRQEQERLDAIARREAEDRQLAQAARAEEAGNQDKAVSILERPTMVAPVVLPSAAPKVAGVKTYDRLDFRVDDAKLVPDIYKLVDEAKIRRALATYGEDLRIPGVTFFKTKVVAGGRL